MLEAQDGRSHLEGLRHDAYNSPVRCRVAASKRASK